MDPATLEHYDVNRMDFHEVTRHLDDLISEHATYTEWENEEVRAALLLLEGAAKKLQSKASTLDDGLRQEVQDFVAGYHDGPVFVDYVMNDGLMLQWQHPDYDEPLEVQDLEEMATEDLLFLRNDLLHRTNWTPATGVALSFIASEMAVRACLYSFDALPDS